MAPNTGVSPNDLYEALDELLTFSATALDTIPTFPACAGLVGAPDARFITPGLPSIDCCPAMWAYAGQAAQAGTSPARTALDAGHRSGAFQQIRLATLNVMVARCTPTFGLDGGAVRMPTSDELAGVARQTYADGWALWGEISNAIKHDTLFSRCQEAFLDYGAPIDTAGGCAGWIFSLRVNLGGYPKAD